MAPEGDDAAAGTSWEAPFKTISNAVAKAAIADEIEDKLLQAGLVTPSCGLGSHAPDLALRAMELTYAVSLEMRRRYGLAVPASTA